ncbi:sensor histidine kinase [Alteromonas oceanisediminis]|uniref:sensor histidine kinase n=1 Tax=Alteromonas oceanisediminis TaxID=2836180 RepID=UPI001BDA97C1|nr:ATP-binding protein [Alteromonas oceanisediminis]MBT0587830.1 PAS domain-containing protein [Alteromonas oceanisediminis]
MHKPTLPDNESQRLKALVSYQIMDTDPDPVFDDITAMIAELCETSIALVSLIDDCRQWFKSAFGLSATETSKDIAFCAHAIHQNDIFEVTDTLKDERFHDNPLVTDEPNIRFYAGMPLVDEQGFALGTLCVIDTQPKQLSVRQRRYLAVLAREVTARLNLIRKNRELEEAKALQELITQTNQDYIFVKDKDFRIVQANPAFMSLYPEHARDSVIGFTTIEEFDAQAANEFLEDDRRAFETGRNETVETLVCPDGKLHTIHTLKIRFEDHRGEPFILGVGRDVTEREELIASLTRSNKELDEFAYVASHDLRSPLTAIRRLIGWVEEDEESQLSEESASHIAMINVRANRMDRLLTDLLDYARVGKEEHQAEPLNFRKVTMDCVALLDMPASFSLTAEDSQLQLPKLPLQLVLTNLISNAIKHHDRSDGNIRVQCSHQQFGYEITVSDDGPGIDPAYHEKVFQRFQTLQPRDKVEGTGLGLSMVQKMVEHYGGSISLTSSPGQGASFTIVWPVEK